MEETLVSFEVAKLLKEKGFDCNCYAVYDIRRNSSEFIYDASTESKFCDFDDVNIFNNATTKYPFLTAAPTQSLAQKWLREVHEIHIRIECIPDNNTYLYMAYKTGMDKVNWELKCLNEFIPFYPTYEEALDNGLLNALQSLN